jgi:hypothetical protein
MLQFLETHPYESRIYAPSIVQMTSVFAWMDWKNWLSFFANQWKHIGVCGRFGGHGESQEHIDDPIPAHPPYKSPV